jgi:glycosyltransferase involved in cell wall biosynthesis
MRPAGATTGQALLSYLHLPVGWSEHDPRLGGHTNAWESRQIAKTLVQLGFVVDAVAWDDRDFVPSERYDVVLAIEGQLDRLAVLTGSERLLLHITGSYPRFSNAAELRRLDELDRRRGVRCVPRRALDDLDGFDRALDRATSCSLLGNAQTLATFPAGYRSKITLIPVTASPLAPRAVTARSTGREFVWFFGSGAVHKGLDRVLEAFARNPSLTLNVVGNILDETDFVAAYREELALANIHCHGYLDPTDPVFARIVARSCAFVAPSCSEGASPAVATCMAAGLLPVISRATGIDVPPGAGIFLEECSVDEIELAVHTVAALPADELAAGIASCRDFARSRYSRASFGTAIRSYLARALGIV